MSDEIVTALGKFDAPWGRQIELQDVRYESGLRLMRVRIREGARFTVLELDDSTAAGLARAMLDWAGSADLT